MVNLPRNIKSILLIIFLLPAISGIPGMVESANTSLYLSPQTGTFSVGRTYSVSIYVDTKSSEINVVEVGLKFPPEAIQVTSPTTGESFVTEWLSPPSYSNTEGTVSFRGGIPGGIITSAGLISTITFRAKSPGVVRIDFLDYSKVLLNDGKGTPVLATVIDGGYKVVIPPPEGPRIHSSTHPDSDVWYRNNNPSFDWEKESGVTDYSFSLSQNPQEEPDTVSEGDFNFKSYSEVPDGIWYFHLKEKKGGSWGRTSHAVVKIDTASPQEFSPKVDTHSRFIYFETTDLHSGIDYYEVSVREIKGSSSPQPFFTEAVSPFKIPYEKPGKYSVLVRAHDKAGNLKEAEVNFRLITPIISYVEGEGIQFKGFLFSWLIIYLFGFILIGSLGYLIFWLQKRGKFGFKKGIKEIEEALVEIKRIEEREREIMRLREKFEEKKGKLEEELLKRETKDY